MRVYCVSDYISRFFIAWWVLTRNATAFFRSSASKDDIQKRLLHVYDTLAGQHPNLDARVVLPSPGAHVLKHLHEADAILSAPGESGAIDSLLRQRSSMVIASPYAH
jgi:hypothetical protein